jgi:NAD(P)-dependent dehydrogenase (short-subunit alcohol dehydrogenase family)
MKYAINQGNALIVGASQGIGLGFVRKLLQDGRGGKIYATYRCQASATDLLALESEYPERICCMEADVTDEGQISQTAARIEEGVGKLHLVVNCAGILHEENLQPEKSLKQITPDHLLRYFQVNSIATPLLAKHLLPLFRHGEKSLLAAISAKVGSIGDNQLGGWYGYRASKAALNMFMRNIAIEYRRTSPQTIVALLHPGTTDTRLSQPFQKNVPAGKLFSVERTVSQLLEVMENLDEGDSGQFFSWDGSRLPW